VFASRNGVFVLGKIIKANEQFYLNLNQLNSFNKNNKKLIKTANQINS